MDYGGASKSWYCLYWTPASYKIYMAGYIEIWHMDYIAICKWLSRAHKPRSIFNCFHTYSTKYYAVYNLAMHLTVHLPNDDLTTLHLPNIWWDSSKLLMFTACCMTQWTNQCLQRHLISLVNDKFALKFVHDPAGVRRSSKKFPRILCYWEFLLFPRRASNNLKYLFSHGVM
jgi:hypothetical protein